MEETTELKSIQAAGKSVDEAIFKGLQQMEISIDEVTIEIIQQETKGILGIGAKPAIVKLTQRPPEEYEVPDYMKEAEERRQRKSSRYDKPDRRDRKREERAERTERPERQEKKDRNGKRREQNEAPAEQMEKPAEAKPVCAAEPARCECCEPAEPRKAREPKAEAPAVQPEQAEEAAEQIEYSLEEAKDCPAAIFVSGLIERMGAPGQVLAARAEDSLRLRIDSEKMGMLIGHRGETLDAMQYLTSLVINRNRKTEGYTRVTLNTEDYREKREETLRRLAKKVAAQVKATGRAKTLEPMNPYERRVLHSTLQNHPYVTTHSEGDEPNRRVVVTPRRRSRGGYRKPRFEKAAGGESFAAEESNNE